MKHVKLFEAWSGKIDPSFERAVDIIIYFMLIRFDPQGGNNSLRQNWEEEDNMFNVAGPDLFVNMELTDCVDEIELVNRAIKNDPTLKKFLKERTNEYGLEIQQMSLDPEETVANLHLPKECGVKVAHGYYEDMSNLDSVYHLPPGTIMGKITEFYETKDDKIEALRNKYHKRLRAKSSGLI
jgi:hypothetical protein